MTSLDKRHLVNLSIIVYLVLLISILQITKPMVPIASGMGDAHVRVSVILNNTIQNHGVWPPAIFYVLKFFINLFGMYTGPRIFGIFFFLLLTVSVYLLSNKIGRSSKAALLTSILFITLPYFSRYITFPLTEIPFALFVLLGIYFLLDFKKIGYIVIAAVFFAIANTIRFDGLIFLPVLLIYLYKRSKKTTWCLLFLAIYLSYHVYYFIQNYLFSGSFLYIFNDYKTQTLLMNELSTTIPSFFESVLVWLKNIFINFNPPIFILGIISLLLLRKRVINNHKLFISLSCISIFLIFMLRLIAPSDWYPEEYLFLPILLIYFVFGASIYGVFSQSKLFKCILMGVIIFNLSRNYLFTVDHYPIAEISKQLQKINGHCLYVLNDKRYPFDRDEIMFLGKHAKYVSVSEQFYEFEDMKKYDCFILDNLESTDVQKRILQDKNYKTIFSNNRYVLIGPN